MSLYGKLSSAEKQKNYRNNANHCHRTRLDLWIDIGCKQKIERIAAIYGCSQREALEIIVRSFER